MYKRVSEEDTVTYFVFKWRHNAKDLCNVETQLWGDSTQGNSCFIR